MILVLIGILLLANILAVLVVVATVVAVVPAIIRAGRCSADGRAITQTRAVTGIACDRAAWIARAACDRTSRIARTASNGPARDRMRRPRAPCVAIAAMNSSSAYPTGREP